MGSDFTSFETTNWQNVMMDACADVKDVTAFQDRMLVRWAILVEPSLDVRRVSRAFKKLCDRYDALRMTFYVVNGRNEARVHKAHPVGVTTQDIGAVSDAEFHAIVEKAAAQPMSAVGGPVCEMIVLKFGGRGDVLLVRVHQVICDGYSIVLFIEDFLKYLIGMPIPFPAMTHNEFIRDWERPDMKISAQEEAFWTQRLLPAPASPALGRSGQRDQAFVPPELKGVVTHDVPLSKAQIAQIETATQKEHATFYAYAFSAFGEAICEMGQAPATYISTIVGRNDKRLNTYFGHFSRLLVSIYHAQSDKALRDRLRYTSKMLTEGMQQIERKGVRLENRLGAELMEGGLRPFQFAVHTTRAYGRMKSSVFSHGFMAERDSVRTIGRYRLKEIKIKPPAEAVAELQLNIEETEAGHSLSLAGDHTAYTQQDLEAFSDVLKRRLIEGL